MSDRLLDTSVVIDYLRGNQAAISFVDSLNRRPQVSAVTLTEIFAGLRSQKEERAARGFFAECKVITLDAAMAEHAGVLLRHYGASHAIDVPDALIAATAETRGLALATLNIKHFPMFPRLKRPY